MENLLISIVNGIVENKDEVNVTMDTNDEGINVYHLHVAPDDMGRVIGKSGRIIHSIRAIMRSAASRIGKKISVEVE